MLMGPLLQTNKIGKWGENDEHILQQYGG
jgi:hypothetical protein